MLRDLRGKERCDGCGYYNVVSVLSVVRKSPNRLAGTAITLFGGFMAAHDGMENRVLLHPNCHQQVHSLGLRLRNRVLKKAFERLERLDGKLSRVVLRGGRGSNAVSLPDNPSMRLILLKYSKYNVN